MHNEILSALRQLEAQHGCHFLFAAESGSRAWGFASPDSDYDVRAIYVNPLDWYLSTETAPKDTIEAMLPGDLDISAWELRKALRLFATGNLSLYEWITSPILYWAVPGFLEELQALLPLCFPPLKATHHYLSLARQAYASLDEEGTISLKKLFYLLRGTLAAKWCRQSLTMPPVPFPELLTADLMPPELLAHVQSLLKEKQGGGEKARTSFTPDLRLFFHQTQQECQQMAPPNRPPAPAREVWDGLLRKWVRLYENVRAPEGDTLPGIS